MPTGTRRSVTAALAVLLLLSGCAGGTGGTTGREADVDLVGCDELVPSDDLVAAALTDVAGVEPSPVPAMPPLEFDPFPMLLPAAGGLRCSWNAGAPAVDFTSDWGYLSVEAIPYDGDAVNVRDADGEPIASSTSIRGHDAVAACRGWAFECVVAASVEGVWMQVRLQWPAFNSVSRFAAVNDELVLDRLAAVAEPAFAAVAEAGPERLDWPAVTGEADCNGIAPTAPPGGMPADALPEFSRLIVEGAGVVACALEGGRLYIVPGAGDLMEGMLREPDFDGALEPLDDRIGYPALGRASGPGGMLVILTIAEDAYVIDAGDAVAYARDILTARVADYAGPQRDESLRAPDIATAEAEGLALVEGTAAELGLTIATTYPPERRRCEHPDGFPGVVSEVVVTTAASSTPDEELFELVDRYWSSRSLTVYHPDNGIAAEGTAGGLISTVYLTASEFGGGPSIRVQLPCALE
ncbi:hypothetical protein [Agromyces ramosus]|uniref:Uncharacterized protein n=1 Tax=Agromyces ramosus TaxID=33879 RepID=A0ABU0R699_9MICO|nr:hypothetical protein [Agromyces ramosus]MDQ0893615.1 hypothetical protein [Agromyces ramosus]